MTDLNSGYTTAPSYTVQFTRVTPTPVYISVTLKSGFSVLSTATGYVQAAIISAFNGRDGGTRARIASLLFASRYYAPIAALGSWVQIVEITIGIAANPAGFTLQMQADQIPTIEAANIAVAIA
ncbi:hypothetical protein ACWM9A_11770 [Acetobacter pasteurianus]